ncbi:MAG: GAF domain-containing protein [Rhizobium sp.]
MRFASIARPLSSTMSPPIRFFSTHHTPAIYGLQSYISMPIVLPDGTFFGTLCAIDKVARKLNTPTTLGMFRLFADLIAFHLDANKRVLVSEAKLKVEQASTNVREEFIAVLGHDLSGRCYSG